MAKKKLQVVTIDSTQYGIIGVLNVNNQDYIALSTMDGEDMIEFYRYYPSSQGFDIGDIESEEEFNDVVEEFEYIMENQLWD